LAICNYTTKNAWSSYQDDYETMLQGSEPECEVTEVEVRVDPMLFLCALEEDGSNDDEDNTADSSCQQASSAVK
jgi:hypothetical protein